MRTFSQEQNQFQNRSNTATPGLARREHPVLHLQRTIGNRAVRRMLQRDVARDIQLKRGSAEKPTQPTLITERRGNTDRIEHAYGAGSLNQTQWGNLIAEAKQAITTGQNDMATRAYLTLYADIAKLAQATWMESGGINIVTGKNETSNDARPGLNLSMLDTSGWGHPGVTAYVNLEGKFPAELGGRGQRQPAVAIVLCRDAFLPEKEQTLGILRHEMVHAEHLQGDADAALLSNPKDKLGPVPVSHAKTELLAYTEGFMTMFHLRHPAPTSPHDPAFFQLLGALDGSGTHGWADVDGPTRSEALGRLQEYYCHALDPPHRRAFDAWVDYELAAGLPGDAIQSVEVAELQAHTRKATMRDDFFHGLKGIITSNCKGLTTPMKL